MVAQAMNSVPAQSLISQTMIPGVKFREGKVRWKVDTVGLAPAQRSSHKIAWLVHVNPKSIKWKLRVKVQDHLAPPGVRSRKGEVREVDWVLRPDTSYHW